MPQSISYNNIRFNNYTFAVNYKKKHFKMTEKFGKEFKKKLIDKNFGNGNILDAGCGFGETLIYLGRYFEKTKLYGIDLSEVFIEMAEKRANEFGLSERVTFQKADVLKIPFPDNFFDVVINTNMLHLVDDPVLMLNEIERVLAPTGYFFITDIKKSFLGIIEKEIRIALSNKELINIIKNSKLRKGKVSANLIWWKYEN